MASTSGTALLVMDYQNGIVSRYNNDISLLERVKSVISVARNAGIPIIFVTVKFREGYPEINPNNLSFSTLKNSGMQMTEVDDSTAVHPLLAPKPGDILVAKRRVGAFSGSDLDVVLRSQGINTLVLAGIATSGVVLSTLRYAADMDYKITVLSDCCADMDPVVHDVLMTKVFPRQATVITADEWRLQNES